ncbi:MAG TPA: isoprenylcysteine carboxylmethyltransferase family protein [Acidobacteriaceae bacterium]|jgi:protein-S-isoprenylcysteine O-methyltransferase Ste14|nr:isoprenylcysteine carboxylmethyltransferase family protein [Acidobacteriaceae bacterium]
MSLSLWWTGLYLGWVAGEIFIAVATRTRGGEAKSHDRGTQLVLWITIVAALTASGWLQAVLRPSLPHALRPLSLALLVAGLIVRIAAILTLGRSFTANVATRSTQTIVRRGLYRVVRHPSYLGMEIIFLAVGLHARNWICLAVCIVPTTAAVLWRIHVEESALRAFFGDAWAHYTRTTKKLIPGLY